jgi:hypothetical protein
LATNKVPQEYTKSTPNTIRTVDGKPKAQYVTDVLISANRIPPDAVSSVPVTGQGRAGQRHV